MRTLTLIAAALTLSACVADVGKDKVKADVQDIKPETTHSDAAAPAPAPAAGTALKVDVANSHINALGAKVTATHPIMWKGFEGQVMMDGETFTGVSFTVDMATMEADVPKLTEHLKAPDFFDVAAHPTATFKSTEVKAGSDKGEGYTHTVVGEFMVHGMTKQLTFPAKVAITPEAVKAETEFVIDRTWFGVTYAGRADDLIQNNVKMNIDLSAPRG
ncbi:MAG: YceI family protein [Myxococcota bacterium]